jgi:hypothetical protein
MWLTFPSHTCVSPAWATSASHPGTSALSAALALVALALTVHQTRANKYRRERPKAGILAVLPISVMPLRSVLPAGARACERIL